MTRRRRRNPAVTFSHKKFLSGRALDISPLIFLLLLATISWSWPVHSALRPWLIGFDDGSSISFPSFVLLLLLLRCFTRISVSNERHITTKSSSKGGTRRRRNDTISKDREMTSMNQICCGALTFIGSLDQLFVGNGAEIIKKCI